MHRVFMVESFATQQLFCIFGHLCFPARKATSSQSKQRGQIWFMSL